MSTNVWVAVLVALVVTVLLALLAEFPAREREPVDEEPELPVRRSWVVRLVIRVKIEIILLITRSE